MEELNKSDENKGEIEITQPIDSEDLGEISASAQVRKEAEEKEKRMREIDAIMKGIQSFERRADSWKQEFLGATRYRKFYARGSLSLGNIEFNQQES